MTDNFKKVEERIKKANKICLVYAANVDPDAYGSVYAFFYYLQELKKEVFVANYHGNIKSYFDDFPLPEKRLIRRKKNIEEGGFDLFISFDGSSIKRIGLKEKIFTNDNIIHFDHHLVIEETKGLVLDYPEKASTTELLFDYFDYLKFKLTTKIADGLLMGIIVDTHNFQHSNTSSELFEKVARITSVSNKAYQISNKYIYKKSIKDLQLLGEVLRRLKFNKEKGMVISILDKKTMKKYDAAHKDLSMASYFLNTTKGAKFTLLLTEKENGQIKGSLRSEKEKGVNVAEIAKVFEGGGHMASAGFRLKGKIVKTGEGEWKVI